MLSYHDFMTEFCGLRLRHKPWTGYMACHPGHAGPRWVRPVQGVIYYAHFAEVDLIKIGYTTDIRGRMRHFRPTSVLALEEAEEIAPVPVRRGPRLFVHNSLRELGWQRHQQFAASHCQGEYFHPTDELLSFIASLGYDFASAVRPYQCTETGPGTAWRYSQPPKPPVRPRPCAHQLVA